MTIETQQLPVASVQRVVVMVVIFVMDCELTEFLAVKLSSAVRTDPRKEFKSAGPVGEIVVASRHESPWETNDSARHYYTPVLDYNTPSIFRAITTTSFITSSVFS